MSKNIHKAFTMLELVVIIMVVGIIAVALLPKNNTDILLHNAAKQIISDIRYTQHLALMDDRFNTNNTNWYKSRWSIVFNKDNYTNQKWAYTIFSDYASSSSGNPDIDEVAKNPLDTEKYLSGGFTGTSTLDYRKKKKFLGTPECNIGTKYGIEDVLFSSECSYRRSKRIGFDHLGRPLKGKLSSYNTPYMRNRLINKRCLVTLVAGESNITIAVEPETAHLCIYDTKHSQCY